MTSATSSSPAVTRAALLLDLLADSDGSPLTLSELARAAGLAKSSTSNICRALVDARLICRTDSGYVLGRKVAELGGKYVASFDQVTQFYRVCATLPYLRAELVQVALLDGTEVMYLARHEGRAPLRLSASIGDRFPASVTAVGNALLAQLPPEEVARRFSDPATMPELTEKSVRTLPDLQAKLARVRERGFALDDGEVHPAVIGVATYVPPRASGRPPLAVGASVMRSGARRPYLEQVLVNLRELVVQLTNPLEPSTGRLEDGHREVVVK